MKKCCFLLVLFISLGCHSQKDVPADKDATYSIALGETLSIDSYTIAFVEVLEDSRCPKNMTCVWQGRARVKLIIEPETGPEEEQIVILGKLQQEEETNTVLVSIPNHALELVALSPYPDANTEMDTKSYTLMIQLKE